MEMQLRGQAQKIEMLEEAVAEGQAQAERTVEQLLQVQREREEQAGDMQQLQVRAAQHGLVLCAAPAP